jgi:hypothetical protein
MTNKLDYYKNPDILKAISFQTKRIRHAIDAEDCQQEIFAELYDYMPLETEEAIRIVNRVGAKFRRNTNEFNKSAEGEYDDSIRISFGDGNYQVRSHMSPGD